MLHNGKDNFDDEAAEPDFSQLDIEKSLIRGRRSTTSINVNQAYDKDVNLKDTDGEFFIFKDTLY